MGHPTSCPLCHPLDRTIVLQNDLCRFLQEPQLVLVGSGIIVPKTHRPTVFDLTAQEWAATYDLLRQARTHLDQLHAPEGYNLGWNTGVVAGQEIDHAHLHLIPRFQDEPHAGKGIRYWLKQPDNRRPN